MRNIASSLQPEFNSKSLYFNGYGNGSVDLPAQTSINVNANYIYQGKSKTFAEPFSQLIMNVTANKKFFKKKNLVVGLSVNDLFNQNSGFSRSVYGNSISQRSYLNIRRYFMLNISWDFSSMGEKK